MINIGAFWVLTCILIVSEALLTMACTNLCLLINSNRLVVSMASAIVYFLQISFLASNL